MNFRFVVVAGLWLASLPTAFAESLPADPSQPSQLPLFSVGVAVEWRDGSRGRIVAPAAWHEQDHRGRWYYTVQFGGPDSLQWLLPESGLQSIDEVKSDR